MSVPDTRLPNLAALLAVIAGLLVGAWGGLGSGSIAGGIIAGLGIVPACWGMWAGMQHRTQHAVVWSILLIVASLGVAGLLILLRFVDWLR